MVDDHAEHLSNIELSDKYTSASLELSIKSMEL